MDRAKAQLIWGCLAHVLKKNTDKLEARSKLVYFVGYPKGTKGYQFYDPKEHTVVISTHAVFLEEDYIQTEGCRDFKLEEISEDIPSEPVQQESQPITETPSLPTPVSSQTPQRSGRSTRASERYMYRGKVFEAILETMVEDPTRYDEAVADVDSCLWQTAMKAEIKSMYSNQV